MNPLSSIKPGQRRGLFPALLASVIFAASTAWVVADGTNAPVAQAGDVKPAKKPEKKKLTGAELYQINCTLNVDLTTNYCFPVHVWN